MLSPLTRARIRALAEHGPSTHGNLAARRSAIECYRCPVCLEVHDDEAEAEECCQGPTGLHAQEASSDCPVCGTAHADSHQAADCCLWHDIGATERRAMADRVESGLSTWPDELARASAC